MTPLQAENSPLPALRRADEDPLPLLSVSALTKDYAGFRALDSADFELRAGETHVLFGENGAGKSTLISILAGAQRQTSGEVRFRGKVVRPRSTLDARAYGVGAVFQEFSLAPQMTVEENIFLGAEESRRGFLVKKKHRHSGIFISRKRNENIRNLRRQAGPVTGATATLSRSDCTGRVALAELQGNSFTRSPLGNASREAPLRIPAPPRNLNHPALLRGVDICHFNGGRGASSWIGPLSPP